MNCNLVLPYDLLLVEANIIYFVFAPFLLNRRIYCSETTFPKL